MFRSAIFARESRNPGFSINSPNFKILATNLIILYRPQTVGHWSQVVATRAVYKSHTVAHHKKIPGGGPGRHLT
jgi:hypothetical protein